MKDNVVNEIDSIIKALRNINEYCEKSIDLCDQIDAGYPMQASLDEMIIDFIAWKEAVAES